MTHSVSFKKHFEYHKNGQHVIKSKLVWLSDCVYQVTMIKNNVPNFPFGKGTIMTVTIEKIAGNEIYYSALLNGHKMDGHMTKIE